MVIARANTVSCKILTEMRCCRVCYYSPIKNYFNLNDFVYIFDIVCPAHCKAAEYSVEMASIAYGFITVCSVLRG
ncbi:hypothetical protein NM04_04595 [Massilia aurea]|uniref:Uncharacterized protein n=1 Tax=Massilia aurea TaxID=373040 RepID=A0A422QPM3_9BURK|nr:hypothetical protein NM04_04595 [Massilia aurea]